MAKKRKKTQEQVVSIEAYRQARTEGVVLTHQILAGRWHPGFTWKDWSALLAQLKTERSQVDRAIVALTKLAIGRDQRFLNQTNAPERKHGRR
jgi:hypothetical protein